MKIEGKEINSQVVCFSDVVITETKIKVVMKQNSKLRRVNPGVCRVGGWGWDERVLKILSTGRLRPYPFIHHFRQNG